MGRKRNPIYEAAYLIYQKGISLEKVALKIGVTRQCLYKAFVRRNYILRHPNLREVQEYDGKKFTLRNNGYFSMTKGKRTLMHRYIWEKEKGPIPQGWDIHHINFDKTDNSIDNLECLPKSEHTKKYSPHNNQYTKGRKNVTH